MARMQPTRGGSSQAAGFAAGRGLLIVLCATAVGVLLLAKAVDPNGGDTTAGGSTTASTIGSEDGGQDVSTTVLDTTPTTTASTIAAAKEPQTVMVLVANGRGVAGAAKANTDALSVQNYNVLTPTDYPNTEPATKVYFTPDYQADAIAIAQALTIDVAAVAALPAEGLPLDTKGAAVIVVLGTDNLGLAPS
jgi:hypothetical protein